MPNRFPGTTCVPGLQLRKERTCRTPRLPCNYIIMKPVGALREAAEPYPRVWLGTYGYGYVE